MISLTIYPYNRTSDPLIDYISSENTLPIKIKYAVPLKGWLGDGTQATENNDITVTYNIKCAIDSSDALCVVETWIKLDFKVFIVPVIRYALQRGKYVYFARELTSEESDMLSELTKCSGQLVLPEHVIPSLGHFIQLDTPVLAVGGYSEGIDKHAIQLRLAKRFREYHLNVLLIASNPCVSLWGDHFVPSFMFSNTLSENDKVRAFNSYVANLESRYNPDIIILGIPGAIVSNDPESLMDFGIISYEIALAARPDDMILVSPYGSYQEPYYPLVEKLVFQRLGVHIIRHHISKYAYDLSMLREMSFKSPVLVDEAAINKIVSESHHDTVANLYSDDELDNLCRCFIAKYGSYSEIGAL